MEKWMSKKILIIGGVAGGATAATRLRRLSEDDEIILFEKGEYISFANCGLPYHVGGVIKDREELLLQTPEGMGIQYGLDIRNHTEVIAIDPKDHKVTAKNHLTGEVYEESYDKLVISTGARPIIPEVDGYGDADNIFTLRNIPDMDQIISYIDEKQVKVATVIGGGFIGLEMMENLTELGIQVQLVELAPQVMTTLDFELAQMLHAQIGMHQVKLILNDGLKAFRDKGKQLLLNSGEVLDTDMTILSIGVLPENRLAQAAGIELGFKGGIHVNERLETSIPDIYAIGDAIATVDSINGQATNIPLASPANRQGRLVADVINGIEISYPGIQGTSVAKVFELTAASTGSSSHLLDNLGIAYDELHIHPNDHASYYPGAAPMALKLLMGKDGKIFGAQAVGTSGVEKRIDVIATAIKFGAKAPDLAAIELAYAPPFGSAKDPVNMLGYYADNLLNQRVQNFQWSQVENLKKANAYFLDVREDFELATGNIEGSMQIPLNQLRDRLQELPKDQPIYVYCQVGSRGYNAVRILKHAGFEAFNLDGGYKTYKTAKYQIREVTMSNRATDSNDSKRQANQVAQDTITLDACGLQCPGPILKVKENIDKMADGQVLEIQASDFGFSADIENWCRNTGNTLLENKIEGKHVFASIAKGQSSLTPTALHPATQGVLQETKDGATMVVFSGDLDKALASMIIASGAAAYGKQVTIFFTFWGLSILKKQKVKKSGMAKLFDIMLPSSADKLPLSNMNMGGLGRGMIKSLMKKKNVDTLPDMIQNAHDLGVKFVACTMSMDLMGIEKEELFDFVEYGGVATFIGDSEKANMQLFI